MTFDFRPIKAPRFQTKGITKDIRKTLEEEGYEQRRLLRETTKTWKGTRPNFTSEVKVSHERMSIESKPIGKIAGTRGRALTGSAKWWYLELGTRIRWAVMSKDWQSKTTRATLSSQPGSGRVVIAGRRAMMQRNIRARPGIRARNWRAEINRLRSRKFKGLMQRRFKIMATNIVWPQLLRRR